MLQMAPSSILADGSSTAVVSVSTPDGAPVAANALTVRIRDGRRYASVESVREDENAVKVTLRASILPGAVTLLTELKGYAPAEAKLETRLDTSDRMRDGTPDFLRLDDEADRQAFREWFSYLSEWQYYRAPEKFPQEIKDCAALLRFAYREALRPHDGRWASDLELPSIPRIRPIAKYQYPSTPLEAGLFRVKSGAFQPADVTNGAFAQFADAGSIRRWNTHFVSRDLRLARFGDLLFFRQAGHDLPYHSMVFLGRSHFEPDGEPVVVYHTGPEGNSRGEMRRLTLSELEQFPLPKWRPLSGNENFLGVYRWNILKEAD